MGLIAPFRDFIVRHGGHAFLILALIAVYRISDVVMGVMSNPFYVDMGYTKDEVATVSKVYGVIMTIAGAAMGGVLIAKMGIMRTLFLGAVLSATTNLLFVWLSGRGHDLTGLIFTISADNLSAGIASSAFIAYLSGAYQFRLFGYAICTFQFRNAVAAEVYRRVQWRLCRRLRLCQFFHRYGASGASSAGPGMACWTGKSSNPPNPRIQHNEIYFCCSKR